METKTKSNDPRFMLAQLILHSAIRGAEVGGKASEDCKKVREGIAQFPIEQTVASVNLNVVLQEDGFVIVGGIAGNIMAVRALMLILDAQISEQEEPSKTGSFGDDFLETIMGKIMSDLMEAGGSSKPGAESVVQETKEDPKQAEADAHLNETFGDIKSPVIPVESPADCEDNK